MPLRDWLGGPGLLSALLGAVVASGMAVSLNHQNEMEGERAAFLKNEVAKLEREIAEVRSLRDEIMQLLARKHIAETLQLDRATAVQLLEQLARQRPAGVQITQLREAQGQVLIEGRARSGPAAALLANRLTAAPPFSIARLAEVRGDRFVVNAALKGRQLSAARPMSARFPPDVHPGDPK